MTNTPQKLYLRSSKTIPASQIFVAVLLAAGAVYFYLQKDPFITVLFGFVAVENVVFAVLSARRFVSAENSMLTVQGFLGRKQMDIKNLMSAWNIVAGRSRSLRLKNTASETLTVPLMFDKNDLLILMDYLKPYLTASGVERDGPMQKLLDKYKS